MQFIALVMKAVQCSNLYILKAVHEFYIDLGHI